VCPCLTNNACICLAPIGLLTQSSREPIIDMKTLWLVLYWGYLGSRALERPPASPTASFRGQLSHRVSRDSLTGADKDRTARQNDRLPH